MLFGSFSVPAQTVRQCVALPPVKHDFLAHIHLTTQTPTLGLDTFRHEPAGGLTHAASTQRCRDDNGHDGHIVCICGHDDGRGWWCLWWGGGGLPAWLLLDCRVSSRSAIRQVPQTKRIKVPPNAEHAAFLGLDARFRRARFVGAFSARSGLRFVMTRK